jgi:hypothetical protein
MEIAQDSHGNLIEYTKEDLENFGIELGKVIDKKLKNENVATCKVCYKQLKNNKTDCHYKCKVVSNKLAKIKKDLLNIEFELFCLRHTEGDVDIQVFNSLDNV